MKDKIKSIRHSDSLARLKALTEFERSLLVEAGPGTGKTTLVAGRVVLLIASGVPPKQIVVLNFTEAAAAELRKKINAFVRSLLNDEKPAELAEALTNGLSADRKRELQDQKASLDELTCTTIHGFCRKLIRSYSVETELGPGARVLDPETAKLVRQDLREAWHAAQFNPTPDKKGFGRFPELRRQESKENFLTELVEQNPTKTLELSDQVESFLMDHGKVQLPSYQADLAAFARLVQTTQRFSSCYEDCGFNIPKLNEIREELKRIIKQFMVIATGSLTDRELAELLFHKPPNICKENERRFKKLLVKSSFKKASKKHGERLFAAIDSRYNECSQAYYECCIALGRHGFARLLAEFKELPERYDDYKRKTALMDCDDLRDETLELVRGDHSARTALAKRYPYILVDEFQDTDPGQAEIIWRLAGVKDSNEPWHQIPVRPGSLFLAGDPNQAIYQCQGADLKSYQLAKKAIIRKDPNAFLKLSVNFRSKGPIINYVNRLFRAPVKPIGNRPNYPTPMSNRPRDNNPSVAAFDIELEDRRLNEQGLPLVKPVRHEEAEIVALTITGIIGSHPVFCPKEKKKRPAKAGDIALIAPTGTGLWIYEMELERLGIPSVTQIGKEFYSRQEIQELIAIVRAIADGDDTLELGALIRDPLARLTKAAIADEFEEWRTEHKENQPLHLGTKTERGSNLSLRQTLATIQSLAAKAESTTPYLLLCEAVEKLNLRPILRARHPCGADQALANLDHFLNLSRSYSQCGFAEFARTMRQKQNDGESLVEGRPDIATAAVSILTMHAAKGLEWPIVFPVNWISDPTVDKDFLINPNDRIVNHRLFQFPDPNYDELRRRELEETRQEQVRLWYVTLTRARDLLMIPRLDIYTYHDWLSLINLKVKPLPIMGIPPNYGNEPVTEDVPIFDDDTNDQDIETWRSEANTIATNRMRIEWRRHEGSKKAIIPEEEFFAGIETSLNTITECQPTEPDQGETQRTNLLHKLMAETLTGEIENTPEARRTRARELIVQLGLEDTEDPATGLSGAELAETIERTLEIPEIESLRPKLSPEYPIYACERQNRKMMLTAGVADAVALNSTGRVNMIVEWISDVAPANGQIEKYRQQLRDCLEATGAQTGLIVFLTSGTIETIARKG